MTNQPFLKANNALFLPDGYLLKKSHTLMTYLKISINGINRANVLQNWVINQLINQLNNTN